MSEDTSDTAVKVAVRIRPLLPSENDEGSSICLRADAVTKHVVVGNDAAFAFDNVFPEFTSQKEVYDSCVSPLVDAFFEGFNATVLAYGQTASGKTYTMGSNSTIRLAEEDYGIIPRVVENIFRVSHDIESRDSNSTFSIRIQYLELYGEDMKDLLDPFSTSKVSIRESSSGGIYISGAREELVTSSSEALSLLEKGSMSRTTGGTRMNESSSRSHAIFTVMLEHKIDRSEAFSSTGDQQFSNLSAEGPEIRRCKFHFVDLAGSERAKKTGAQGLRMKEGIDINKGLLVLGNVISALGNDGGKKAHVPYRDSKLTRMLQDSLGGNSKTVMICCVSPSDGNFSESLNAVRYANRARNIKNRPIVNVDQTSLLISGLRNQIQTLANELLIRRQNPGQTVESQFSDDYLQSLASLSCPSEDYSKPTRPSASEDRQNITTEKINRSGRDRLSSSLSPQLIKLEKEIVDLKAKEEAANESLKFYISKCERLQSQLQSSSEELILAQSERDYYRMNSVQNGMEGDACSSKESESNSNVNIIAQYAREIKTLKADLLRLQNSISDGENSKDSGERFFDTEFTSNVAKLFSSTEEQLKSDRKLLSRMEKCRSANEDSSDDDYAVCNNDEDDDGVSGCGNFEVQDKMYQHRTQLLSTEVSDIDESIRFKEELVHQLHLSQKQYEAMKEFYESKLESLCEEMEAKEAEKQKMVVELQGIQRGESDQSRKDREEKLKSQLHSKELELKTLKRRQQELSNLSKVHTRSRDQIKRLETDIIDLKKQRVKLSKSLQLEKKNYLVSLNSKAREIDKLKRDLSSTVAKMNKLGMEKEQSKLKINKLLNENALRRKKTTEKERSASSLPTAKSTRRLLQSLSRYSHRKDSSLTAQKIREWVLDCLHLLVTQQDAVADLSSQCEQQLLLLHKKKDLELSKSTFVERDNGPTMSEIETAISDVSSQLRFRNTEISRRKTEIDKASSGLLSVHDIADNLLNSLDSSTNEKMIIMMLMEVYVSCKREMNAVVNKLTKATEEIRSLKAELDDAFDKLHAQSSSFNKEIARVEKEYQSKISGLFEHSGFPEIIERSAETYEAQPSQDSALQSDVGSAARKNKAFSAEGFKAAITIAKERNANLQAQLCREEARVIELEEFISECNLERRQVQENFENKIRENNFLEAECRMLRDIVGELRAARCDDQSKRLEAELSAVQLDAYTDFDDETESVLGQYSLLEEEILNTGSVVQEDCPDAIGSDNIFDRLTNPSNFTGTQKNVFKKGEREANRAKVQQIKEETQKKDRKRRDDRRAFHSVLSDIDGSAQKSREKGLEHSSSLELDEDASPSVPRPLTVSRSPNNTSDVFSRLLNPEKFTGIHRRSYESPGGEIEEKVTPEKTPRKHRAFEGRV